MSDTHLRIELETYEKHKSQLLAQDEGKFVVVQRDQLAGVWDTYADALRIGYDHFGLKPFLVKQIQRIERSQRFTRTLRIQ